MELDIKKVVLECGDMKKKIIIYIYIYIKVETSYGSA